MNYESIWKEALAAASTTKSEPTVFKGCGFAWIKFSGRGNFAKWAKRMGLASKAYPTGLSIWYSRVYETRSQNMDEHYEACSKAAGVLRAYGIDAYAECRMD